MNVLVLGSGGREHTLAWAVSRSPALKRLACAPGNAGMARIAEYEDVEATYTRQLINAKGEAAFEEWIQEQRKALGVVIHDDVLELIGEPVSEEA